MPFLFVIQDNLVLSSEFIVLIGYPKKCFELEKDLSGYRKL